jgi:hypothetical protein
VARKFTLVLIWLALTAEVEGYVFEGLWSTWLTPIGTFLFKALPGIKFPPWDLAVLVTLAIASRTAGKDRIRAVSRSILLSFVAILATAAWGALRGGSTAHTVWQVHPFVSGLFAALLVGAVCRTRADLVSFGKVIVYAAVYRAFVLIYFYYAIARHLEEELMSLTNHADTVLFVSGMVVMWVRALEKKKGPIILWTVLVLTVLVIAIVLNNRRIAWLDVGVCALMTYVLMPPSKLKRLMTRTMIFLSPLALAYVVVGWGRSTGIFKPVGSISTMFGSNQDVSSIMRDIENYNLLRTLRGNPLVGTGWGHQYVEEVAAYDISHIFPQYRYLPHNSLLGVIAFNGILGFAAIWQVVPVACYMHARVVTWTTDPTCRSAGLVGLLLLMIVAVQMWGDVAFSHHMVNVMMAVCVGIAMRLPILAGTWTTPPEARSGENPASA